MRKEEFIKLIFERASDIVDKKSSSMRYFILLLLSTSLLASSHRFAGQTYRRHDAIQQYYQNQPHDKVHERTTITGDWGGARGDLIRKGVIFTSEYSADVAANPIGGVARGFSYTGSLGTDLKLDLEKLMHMNGWEFYVDFVWRRGTNLSATKIGNQFPVQQVFGGQTMQLNRLLLRYTAFEDRLRVKFGRLNAGNNFLQSDWYYFYMSNAFCGNPIAVFFNDPAFTAYPHATWGAVVDVFPLKQIQVQLGVYNGNSTLQDSKYHGFNFTFNNVEGVQYIGQVKFLLNQETKATMYSGNYSIGAFVADKAWPKFKGGFAGSNTGWYVLVDQTIYQPDPKNADIGVTPFAAFLFAPKDTNIFPFFFTTGVVYTGAFTGDAQDALSFGIAYGKYSEDSNEQRDDQGLAGQNFEMVYELNYKYQVNHWSYVQPDLQYIVKPKGNSSIQNALVLGLQFGLTF